MIVNITYRCDQCSKEATSDGRKLPPGWRTLIWVPGLLIPPEGHRQPKVPQRHWCSIDCAKAARDENGNPYSGK